MNFPPHHPIVAALYRTLLLCMVMLSLTGHAALSAAENGAPVRFGVLAYQSQDETRARWQPLIDHLNQSGLPRTLTLQVFNYTELDEAVRSRQLDFVLTQPAHYTVLTHREGLYSPLATLLEREAGHVLASFGGVILTHAHRNDIRTLADLRGKRIAISTQSSLGGYQAQAHILRQAGIHLPQEAHLIECGGMQDVVMQTFLAGDVDAAFVRTGVLESFAREGKLDLSHIKIIKPDTVPQYPLILSTTLYPQWAVAALPWADTDMARLLAATLLALPIGGEVATAAKIAGFTVPGNYQTVEDMMRALRMPPFDRPDFRLGDVWERFRWLIVALGVSTLFILLLAARLATHQRTLREMLTRLNSAQQMAKVGNWELDLVTNQLIWSDEIYHIFEIDRRQFGATYEAFLAAIHPEDRDAVNTAYRNSIETRTPYTIEHRLLFADGRIKYVQEQCETIFAPDGRPLRSLGTVQDVSERELTARSMREALVVFNASHQGIITTNAEVHITTVNPAFTEITGYSADEVIGRKPSILKSDRHDLSFYQALWATLSEHGRWEGEIWNRRRNGEIYPQWMTISRVVDSNGKVIEYVALFNDITERKQQEEEIWRQANFDALTGLANRNLFADRLERAIAQAKRHDKKVGLAFLDLDGFKWINDTLGHDLGDDLLVEAAQRLARAVRDQDTVARLGGDEFTVIIQELADPQDMLGIGEKLVSVLRDPFTLGGSLHHVSGSIGITLYPDDGEDVQTLLKNADIAMYKAKQAGKNRYQFYARHMQIDARARLEMEADLRKAIAGQELRLHYQPIVDTDSGELVGAEALVRWEHPQRGMVSPLDFIPVAEDSGLIVPIGAWVLREAARQWAVWRDKGHPPLRISVNVSSVQFREANLGQILVDVLREFAIEPGRLMFEITESVLMDGSAETEARMRELKDIGIGYALDDFGTGFSSLSYLKRFPVDIVKIDRSFVNDCPDDRNDAHLVEAIINMAHSLELRVTAEGVETEAQFEFLRELGCDYLQGYLAGRPLPAEAFEVLIERRQLLLPTDGASVEETRFLAAMRQDNLDVDEWLERLLNERRRDFAGYQMHRDWVSRGLNLRDVVRAHLEWRRRLGQFISTDSRDAAMTIEDAGSAERCQLGGWINAHRSDDECFERLDQAHQDFHRLAGQIVDDHLNGHRTLARRSLMGIAFRKASREVVAALIECYRVDLSRQPAPPTLLQELGRG